MNPRVAVFDLGGVVLDWNPRHLYRKLIADAAEIERFLAEVCTDAWNVEQDGGRTFADAIAERVALFPQHEALIRAYWERHPEMLPGEVPGTAAIIARLDAADVPLYALTNWSAETFARERPLFPVLERFRDIVVSGVEKVKKPDPAIYRILCARGGFAPAEAVFIDDSPRNVDAARAFGLTALRFVDAPTLAADLRALGFPA